MPIVDWPTLSILGTVAGFSFAGAFWLNGKFNDLAIKFGDRLREHEEHDTTRFNDLGLRLQKVELLTDPHGRFVMPSPFGDDGRSHSA